MDTILIRNGMVYDPMTHTTTRRDVAVADERIVSPEGLAPNQEVDAEGCLVTPSLIDLHLHCYTAASDGTNDADTSIWRLKENPVSHRDMLDEIRWGSQVLVPQMTIRGGSIVYCQSDFN